MVDLLCGSAGGRTFRNRVTLSPAAPLGSNLRTRLKFMFPKTRPRRLRSSESLRKMVRETRLLPENLIMPYFVVQGHGVRSPIESMPGHFQLSIDQLLVEAAKALKEGILSVLLFGIPKKKDPLGKEAYATDGIVQQAVRALKKKFPNLVVITDLCFCEYTDHGHCGVIKKNAKRAWDVDNDATLALIRKTAVTQARAGADIVAPSGMIDGAVAAIRGALDQAGFKNTAILAYAAKYASVFYGPFRDAAESTPRFGDRKTYQMDPGNGLEAIKEIREDIKEGADMVMVKP